MWSITNHGVDLLRSTTSIYDALIPRWCHAILLTVVKIWAVRLLLSVNSLTIDRIEIR